MEHRLEHTKTARCSKRRHERLSRQDPTALSLLHRQEAVRLEPASAFLGERNLAGHYCIQSNRSLRSSETVRLPPRCLITATGATRLASNASHCHGSSTERSGAASATPFHPNSEKTIKGAQASAMTARCRRMEAGVFMLLHNGHENQTFSSPLPASFSKYIGHRRRQNALASCCRQESKP